MRVWLHSYPHIDDYIRVRVGSVITPNKATVHLGTRIVFSTDFAEGRNDHKQICYLSGFLSTMNEIVHLCWSRQPKFTIFRHFVSFQQPLSMNINMKYSHGSDS